MFKLAVVADPKYLSNLENKKYIGEKLLFLLSEKLRLKEPITIYSVKNTFLGTHIPHCITEFCNEHHCQFICLDNRGSNLNGVRDACLSVLADALVVFNPKNSTDFNQTCHLFKDAGKRFVVMEAL